ncbi:MAG: alpha/beta hydrolase [Myxococcales bacterium]|nr:alpha/beta hydrolase [Myxococcales bacterium]
MSNTQTIVAPLVAEPVGEGLPLVALHASGMSSRQWARLAKDAPAHHTRFRVLAADLLGVGKTPMPEGPYALSREVDALLALLDTVDEPAFVLGHSFGGLVAIEAALRAPEKFRALALYEPVVVVLAAAHGSEEAKAQCARIGDLMREDVSASYDRWIEHFIDWWNAPGFYQSLPAPARAQYLATAAEAHRQAGVVQTSSATRENLARCAVPTLFVHGDTSPAAARESARIASNAMPDARVFRVEGAGHMAPLTHTSVVNSAVLAFFSAMYDQPL